MDLFFWAEEWRPVEGWPYEVSSLGRVRRTARGSGTRIGHVLKPSFRLGYATVTLSYGNVQHRRDVHVMVCTAWHGAKPSPEMEVRHLDGRKLNNVPSNLTWGTRTEQAADRQRHGTMLRGERHPNVSLADEALMSLRAEHAEARRGRSRVPPGWKTRAAERYGLSVNSVTNALHSYSRR